MDLRKPVKKTPPADISWDEPKEMVPQQLIDTTPPPPADKSWDQLGETVLPLSFDTFPPYDLSWDEPRQGYNPEEYCKANPIILPTPQGLSKKQKKHLEKLNVKAHFI